MAGMTPQDPSWGPQRPGVDIGSKNTGVFDAFRWIVVGLIASVVGAYLSLVTVVRLRWFVVCVYWGVVLITAFLAHRRGARQLAFCVIGVVTSWALLFFALLYAIDHSRLGT
jgi:hypothetical protein